MKLFKLGLRIWIGLTALMSFLGGWALFSHSNKPAPLQTGAAQQNLPAAQLAPLPTLAPLPSLNDPSATGLQPLPSFSSIQQAPLVSLPSLRTSGS